jgi:uncharacterized membrane protein
MRLALRLSATVEFVSLLLMLANLATLHLPAITKTLGPVHGLAYIVTIVLAVLLAEGRHRVWLLALVPAIGGLLSSRVLATASADGSGSHVE